jgi:4-amino-4-deoxy-L-arabinose transferase-like glycosyltransferase
MCGLRVSSRGFGKRVPVDGFALAWKGFRMLHPSDTGRLRTPSGRRGRDYLVLVAAWALLSLPNLGGPSLWDVDEGRNAEAAREMLEMDDWITPHFNYELRTAKPALLYWMQLGAYQLFGINEFSARLPSALASLIAILGAYELGRRMFGREAALLAGLVLGSAVGFCLAAHFANPDALLNACAVLTFFLFWRDYPSGRSTWLVLGGLPTGLGMLAKGPVALVLPGAVILVFLLWSRELGRLFRPWLLLGLCLFLLVSAPWYGWVGAETRGVFLRDFFLKENLGRFGESMENHGGPVAYYLLVLLVGFAPWCVFLAPAGWHAFRQGRRSTSPHASAVRFLLCWVGVYLVFFTVARTKLPNYILPLYAPLALLVGDLLARWRSGEMTVPAWLWHASLFGLVVVGLVTAGGLLIGGHYGAELLRGRHLPGLEVWAILGVVPVAGALLAWTFLRRQARRGVVWACAATSVFFTATLATAAAAVEAYKSPRVLAATIQAAQREREIRIAGYQYFQPSLVFYTQRNVTECPNDQDAIDFLCSPLEVYLIVPAATWETLKAKAPACRELIRRRDLYKGSEVVLITNRE